MHKTPPPSGIYPLSLHDALPILANTLRLKSYIAPAPISRPVLESEALPTATAPVSELASRSVLVRATPALPYTDQLCRNGRMPMPDSESACALYFPLIVSAAGLDAAAL